MNKVKDWIVSRLVPDWNKGLTWYSNWAMGITAGATYAWQAIPEDWQAVVPTEWLSNGVIVMMFLGITGRMWDQKK